jgi:hypothetical protein
MSHRIEDMVTQYNAQQVLLEANAKLIAELKRVKGELEDTLEKNEAYCHQWGAYLATAYRRVLESFCAEAQDFKSSTVSQALWNGCITSLNFCQTP